MAPSHYLNQCCNIVNGTLRNKVQWYFSQNSNIFIQQNALQNAVCQMTSILYQPQCVNGFYFCILTTCTIWTFVLECKMIPTGRLIWLMLSDISDHSHLDLNMSVLLANVFYHHYPKDGINSLWSSDAICWHLSRSTMAQVMACCLTAPSHYLNQCWLIISKVQWHLPEGNLTWYNSAVNH